MFVTICFKKGTNFVVKRFGLLSACNVGWKCFWPLFHVPACPQPVKQPTSIESIWSVRSGDPNL